MASTSSLCPKCQTQSFEGAHFCVRCGTPLGGAAAAAAPAPSEPEMIEVGDIGSIDEAFEALGVSNAKSEPGGIHRGSPPDTRRQERMAEFTRDEVMRRVRMKQSLKRAGLSGLDLSAASLEGVDLARADLDGANLSNAKLRGAVLSSASLRGASLKGADLSEVDLGKADLDGADLTGAKLLRTNLERATLEGAVLAAADLMGSNLRHAVLTRADLTGANLGQAKVNGASFADARLASVILDFVDASPHGDGSVRLEGPRALAFLSGREDEKEPSSRYFGKGDVLRDAILEFGKNSIIHIDSRFENCSIALGDGAELTIGEPGVLKNCEIVGRGKITVHGRFFERKSPGIVGAERVVVSSKGSLVGGIEQAAEATVFAFEPGSRLRVKILKPRERAAAAE
jgi:uncharacterized protein YjbI with pentapeptide repeats